MDKRVLCAIIVSIILIAIVAAVIYLRKEGFATPPNPNVTVAPVTANSYLIADANGNLSITNDGDFNNVNANSVNANSITSPALTVNGPLQADTLQLNNYPQYPTNMQPFVLSYSVNNYKGPIYDTNLATYSSKNWTLRLVGGSGATIGVRADGSWWIGNYANWNNWVLATVEFIPVPLENYYSSYSSDIFITTDSGSPGGLLFVAGPRNDNGNSLIVYDNKGNSKTITSTPS